MILTRLTAQQKYNYGNTRNNRRDMRRMAATGQPQRIREKT